MDPETSELITNSVYSWNPADDTFNFSGHSYVYEKVRTIRNWSPREMEREIKRRVDILDYMKVTGVDNYRQVAKIVSAYYRDPKRIMEEVTNTLEDIEDRPA
jgi:flagellar protein FlaI